MAKLSAHGTEIVRYFHPRYRRLLSVRSDGVTLARTVSSGWKVFRRKRADVSLEEWTRLKLAAFEAAPHWARNCKSLPSMADLERWTLDSVCETVTGDTIEPDGIGRDGAPSWLLALGHI